ncbi:hypothetical protein MYX78_09870, partial [Acidobacteria bacterium AH-259-G07]|nr:hypothetical protein [Acidobacteria bacterium AH-259-G07]
MLAISSLLLMSTTAAHAICPKPTPKVCSSFFESDAVCTGTVNSQEAVHDQDDFIEGWLYRLRVTQVFRGVLGQTAVVYTPNDSSRLLLEEVGREYVLFAGLPFPGFSICMCTAAGPIPRHSWPTASPRCAIPEVG